MFNEDVFQAIRKSILRVDGLLWISKGKVILNTDNILRNAVHRNEIISYSIESKSTPDKLSVSVYIEFGEGVMTFCFLVVSDNADTEYCLIK